MKTFYTDKEEKFISIKFKTFCKKKLNIKYTAPYIYKKNSLIKKRWRIILTIKDFLLLDSGLLLNFQVKAMNTANYL